MKLRFIKQYQSIRPGNVRDITDGVANTLIRRGIAELVTSDVEAATADPIENAMKPEAGRRKAARR